MMSLACIWANVCRLATAARAAAIALIAASLIGGCGVVVRGVQDSYNGLANSDWFWHGRHGDLTEEQRQWLATAWRYVANNTHPTTGLVGAIDGYPVFTMANVAEYLAALHTAKQFELVGAKEFDERLSLLLDFLNTMALVDGVLPNRSYHTESGQMVDAAAQPGIVGWSAIDLGRLLIWLNLYRRHYPSFAEYIDKVVLRWDFCRLLDGRGQLTRGEFRDGGWLPVQEGRLGYEEYAAYGYYLWGQMPTLADRFEPYERRQFYQVPLLVDGRDPRVDRVIDPLLPTPYWYAGMEFNWDRWDQLDDDDDTDYGRLDLARQAHSLYLVQERRWRRDALYTARAEHILSEAPHFVYDAVFGLGSPFPTLDAQGQFHNEAALVSTKAAFMMWVLWDTEYTDALMGVMRHLYDPERGWYEGRKERTAGYDQSLTLATNAAVLQSMLYKQQGKLFRAPPPMSRLQRVLGDEFIHPGRCQPVLEFSSR
ncbi:DUF3131 domain-containing protein [Ferrimonas kyonanensis]|uniref:DUF3131 domain-containing protein n=1 Tax=Ferrimonas kyonanensis TaxID=364763 RepID=UPI000A0462A1|nr:DUF3131 domain-containing protein [Ferrimonas kyonanensis]